MNPLQATGKKKSGKHSSSGSSSSSSEQLAGKGMLLVGDVGIDSFRSVRHYLSFEAKTRATRKTQTGYAIGFDNIASHAAILEQQQQSRRGDK